MPSKASFCLVLDTCSEYPSQYPNAVAGVLGGGSSQRGAEGYSLTSRGEFVYRRCENVCIPFKVTVLCMRFLLAVNSDGCKAVVRP